MRGSRRVGCSLRTRIRTWRGRPDRMTLTLTFNRNGHARLNNSGSSIGRMLPIGCNPKQVARWRRSVAGKGLRRLQRASFVAGASRLRWAFAENVRSQSGLPGNRLLCSYTLWTIEAYRDATERGGSPCWNRQNIAHPVGRHCALESPIVSRVACRAQPR